MGRKGKSKATLAREQKERMRRKRDEKNASIELAPLGEEKLLARRLASLREKNPSNAQGLATPLGSLSIPDKQIGNMPASSDSPEGVCTSAKVPLPEGIAGQTKLVEKTRDRVTSIMNSMAKLHETIDENNDEYKMQIERIEMKNENDYIHKNKKIDDKVERNDSSNAKIAEKTSQTIILTENSKEIETSELNTDDDFSKKDKTISHLKSNKVFNKHFVQISCKSDVFMKSNFDLCEESYVNDFRETTRSRIPRVDEYTCTNGIDNGQSTVNEVRQTDAYIVGANPPFMVQGSFHQGDIRFGNNRGKQCVANSLTALAHSKLSSINNWDKTFLDKILTEGNELYTWIHGDNDELLVTELPEMVEISNQLVTCKRSESILALLDNTGFTSFNVLSLDHALKDVLLSSDCCLVCVKGFTCAIMKQNEKMYLFDSHARNSIGLPDNNGKSIVIEIKDMDHLYEHFVSFVQGDISVQFELTAIDIQIQDAPLTTNNQLTISQSIDDDNVEVTRSYDNVSDVEFVSSDTETCFSFYPLDYYNKKRLCTLLNVPSKYVPRKSETHHSVNLGTPLKLKEIATDGNCFFRAISFAISQRQGNYSLVRTGIVNHILSHPLKFKSFLENETVEEYVKRTGMSNDKVWGTEIEILAAADLLQTDIFTFLEGRWIKYSSKQLCNINSVSHQAIYLKNEGNHFEVVLDISNSDNISEEIDEPSPPKITKREREQLRYHSSEDSKLRKINDGIKRYQTNSQLREHLKRKGKVMYQTDDDFKKLKLDNAKRIGKFKYWNDVDYKNRKKECSRNAYQSDTNFKEAVKAASKRKYETNETHKEAVKTASSHRYTNDPKHKENIIQATKSKREKVKDERKSVKKVIDKFRLEVKKVPDCVCSCCFRLLFEKQVLPCNKELYSKGNQNVQNLSEVCISEKYHHTCTVECDSGCIERCESRKHLWICHNCHRKISSGKIPAECFVNNLDLETVPEELKILNSLEQHLIALNIPFMKILGLPAGGQKGVHGPVVSVPSDISKVISSLPRCNDDDLMLRVKLKRKLSYKGYEQYQFVNTKHLEAALQFLKKNNKWYAEVNIGNNWLNPIPEEISEDNVDTNITNASEQSNDSGNSEEIEIPDSYLDDSLRGLQLDTSLQPADIGQECLDMFFDKVFNVSPAEGNKPVSILQEEGLEAKSFPKHYPSGKNTYDEDRTEKLSLLRYFNLRLLSVENRFAKDTSYIFFCQYMAELDRVISNVQISLRKESMFNTQGKKVTSKMLCDRDKLKELFKKDEAIKYLKPVRGTPPYWQAAQKELFSMLYQLGIPTFFCSFSAADFRWTEVIEAIIRQQGGDTKNVDELDWNEKCKILRENPVTMARMFEHRWHTFLHEVILSPAEPIGKVIDWFYRVEFQQRGSPHTHCLFWIEGAPKLGEDSDEDVINFIDKYITCEVPDEKADPELHEMVTTLHKHSKNHSKSCRKKGTICRFNFPRPPSMKTFIARPSETDSDQDEKALKDKIASLFDIISSNENMSVQEVFEKANMSQNEFENIFISVAKKSTVILKRDPNEIYTNQYNPDLLRSWNANMDIQFVSDAYGCIGYIIDYISKAEKELGLFLMQTHIEAQNGNLSAQETMRKIGTAYLHNREISAQEAIFRVTGLKLKESSRKVEFIPVGDNLCRMSIPLKELQSKQKKQSVESENAENDDEGDDETHWMTNVVDRYKERPRSAQFESMCCATFSSEYNVLAKSQIPKKINAETTHKLGNDLGYIRKRTRTKPAVVRYARFSVEKTPEKYYQSMLQLYLPYRTDEQLKPPKFESYQNFYEVGYVNVDGSGELVRVKTLVDENKAKFVKNEKTIEDAQQLLEDLGPFEDAWGCLCPQAETERRQCLDEGSTSTVLDEEISDVSIPDLNMQNSHPSINLLEKTNLNRKNVLPLLRTLNVKQQNVLYKVRDWCLKKAHGEEVEPFHVFITGGAGTGKSHLIKCLFSEATRILAKTTDNPDDVTVLLTAPTGTAAFNIDGSTIHSALKIRGLSADNAVLSEDKINSLRSVLENLQILIIDEISMVNKRLLFMIHSRLRQLKKTRENIPFGGVSIIAVGDFYQLPPVRTAKIGKLFINDPSSPINHLWNDLFSVVELEEVMRQRDDADFAQMLNRLRVSKKGEDFEMRDVQVLKERITEGPENALHIFATNQECQSFNNHMVMKACSGVKLLEAEDYARVRPSGKLVRQSTNFSGKGLTVPLQQSILIGKGARVMLMKNIDIQDGLVNGAMGTVVDISESSANSLPKLIFVHFDDERVGKNAKNSKVIDQKICIGIEPMTEDVTERQGCRKQFPLQLSWACTIHKVQGLTVKECVVDLNKCFSSGQAYVALSRVTSKNGLFINDLDEKKLKSKIFCDPDVSDGIASMTKFLGDSVSQNTSGCTKIMYHNIQGLVCHKEDLEHNLEFQSADLICISETWLKSDADSVTLKDFEFKHLPRSSAFVANEPLFASLKDMKHGGVGLFHKSGEIVLLDQLVKNLECLVFEMVHLKVVVIVLYRTQKYPVKNFIGNLSILLEGLASYSDKILVVGDFNQNLLKEENHIYDAMLQRGFHQLVCQSTTEGGTLIDHVYIKGCNANVTVKPTYYSYHESIEISVISN